MPKKGREILQTMQVKTPTEERTLAKTIAAFNNKCNPKRNETVIRYRLFSRLQGIKESFEQFATALKNFCSELQF